jgi:hypothetical protein
MELGVHLTVVPSIGEADVICALLQTEGIEAKSRQSFPAEGGAGGGFAGWQEILVRAADLERAREVLTSHGTSA